MLIMQNASFTLKVLNWNLLNMFHITEFEKFWIFFLKSVLIPKLHLLKPNTLLATMVRTIVTMVIVHKV